MTEGDWVSVKTNKGPIEGEVTKINTKTFEIKLRIAGRHKFIKRKKDQLIEIIDF